MKGSIRILSFFSLFLVLLAMNAFAQPNYANYSLNFTNGTNYSLSNAFSFNSTWVNTTAGEQVNNTGETNFTLGLPDGTYATFNMSTTPSLVNNTTLLPVRLNITLTQDQLGGAGTYNYSFSLMTSNSSNTSQTWTNSTPAVVFIITQSPQILIIANNTSLSGTYPYAINLTGSGNLTAANLYRNDTLVSSPNYDIVGAATWNYTFNTSGNMNYSANSTSASLIISKGSIIVSLYLNGTLNSNNTYTYPQSVNATASSSVLTPSLYRDGTSEGISEQVLLGNGTYAYKVNATGNENYSDNATGITFYAMVNKGTPNVMAYLNSLSSNYTNTYPFSVEARGNSTTTLTPPAFSLYVGSYSIGQGNPETDLTQYGAGTYQIVYNTSGNANWSSASNGTLYLIVNKGTPNVTLYINGSSVNSTFNLSSSINLSASSNIQALNVSLSLNKTGFTNDFQINASNATNITSASTLGIGFYNFSAVAIGNANYSNSSTGSLYFFVTNMINTPASSTMYAPSTNYNFTINISKNETIIFSSNINGSYVNYTSTPQNVTNWGNNSLVVSNDSNGTYWLNFSDLGANSSYTYIWFINDSNSWFSTGSIGYTVAQNSTTIPVLSDYNTNWLGISTQTDIISCVDSTAPTAILTISWGGAGVSTAACSNTGIGSTSCTTPALPSTQGYTLFSCTASGNYTGSAAPQNLTYAPLIVSTTSGSSSTTTTSSGIFSVSASPSSITAAPGDNKTVVMVLTNTRSTSIASVVMTLSGLNQSWYSFNVSSVSLAANTGSGAVLLTINVPKSAQSNSYTITITASGTDSNNTALTSQSIITLAVAQNVSSSTSNSSTNATTGSSSQNNGNALGLLLPSNFSGYVPIIIIVAIVIALILFRKDIMNYLKKLQKGKGSGKKPPLSNTVGKIKDLRHIKVSLHIEKKEKKD